MTEDLMTAMRRALAQTRSGNLGDATRTIQSALGKGRSNPQTPRSDTPKASQIDSNPAEAESPPPHKGNRRGSLREVISRLRGWASPDQGGTVKPSMPDNARFEWRNYTGATGARDYRLYVPSTLSGTPTGLILMLHGCTQTPDDFATGTAMNDVAERRGLIVAYPSQTKAFNMAACWNWFRPGDQTGTAGEPAILAGIAQSLMQEFGVDKRRVFAAGLSAGGAMVDILGQTCPDTFAAIGIQSGLPAASAQDAASAFAAMRGDAPAPVASLGLGRPRIIVFHGTDDSTVAPLNGARLIAAARTEGTGTAEDMQGAVPGGRTFSRSTVRGVDGVPTSEYWLVDGAGHGWSGGSTAGTFTDPQGPDASVQMVRFFLAPFTTGNE